MTLPARDNPFRATCIERLPFRLDDADWLPLMTRFQAHHWRGVLVGPHGSGKTTLREELERRLSRCGWQVRSWVLGDGHRITWAEVRSFATDRGERTLLSIDGLDRIGVLSWWRLQRMLQPNVGILATSHVHGRQPTLHQHQTTPGLLHDLVAALTAPTVALALRARCTELYALHHGNVRACLRDLYDDWAGGSGHCTSRSD